MLYHNYGTGNCTCEKAAGTNVQTQMVSEKCSGAIAPLDEMKVRIEMLRYSNQRFFAVSTRAPDAGRFTVHALLDPYRPQSTISTNSLGPLICCNIIMD